MTLEEIADALHCAPHLAWSEVQECHGSEESTKRGQDPNTKRVTRFVIILATGNKNGLVRREAATINEALHVAFRDMHEKDEKVKMPAALKANFPWKFKEEKKSQRTNQ